jgi:hypothetical protein
MVAPDMAVSSNDAAVLAAIIRLADDIPTELLTIGGADYTNFIFGLESMRSAVDRWNYRGGDDPPRTHEQKSPVYLVREALCKCPDQNPSPQTTALTFISDLPLRESIRLDISNAHSALHANDYKTATVIAGSAIEALLLWAIQDKGVTGPIAGMNRRTKGLPEVWHLSDLSTQRYN